MKFVNIFLKGLLAGIAISFGGLVYIMTRKLIGNAVLGAYLFSIGLILVCNFGYFLYTGKICYLIDELKNKTRPNYIIQLILGYLGNVIGALIFGLTCKLVLDMPDFVETMISDKVNDEWYSLIIKGIFCGILIYLAVEGFKKSKTDIGKYVILILCVGTFIVCGFEHSIADAFYFSLSENFLETIPALLLITLGNTIGGLLFPVIKLIIKE